MSYKFMKLHYSNIPSFLGFVLISSLFLFSCAGTQRFGKDESKVKGNNSRSLETVEGVASFYSDEYHGNKTANGETYDMYAMTAAHKTYSFNTEIRVTNLSNGKSVVLRINDRMPGYKGRIIDVSFQAARDLGMIISGIAEVRLEVLKWGED